MGERLRILHVITRLELGGAQRNTLFTVEHLDTSEFEAALAWGPGDQLDPEAERLAGVRLFPIRDLVRAVRPLSDRRALADLRTVIRAFAPDVVHTHSSKAGVLGRLAAHLEGTPVVVHTIHGFGFTPLQPPPLRAGFLTAERMAARWTDHTITVSLCNLRLGVELGIIRPGAGSVIRSGIDLTAMTKPASSDREVREALAIDGDGEIVVQVGNFKPQKAPENFVRVAARLASDNPQTTFVMVGDGPLRRRCERLAHRLGVVRQMRFVGWSDNVASLLSAAAVSVLTSVHEGLPRAVVESLAAGVPVVATAVDGTPEVVQHGVNGLLVEPGDVPGIAAAVDRMLNNEGLRSGMASAAGRGLAEFDIDFMVRQQEDLYRCLCGQSRC